MIVAVVAHPDDESLIAGGTLARAARAGTPTGVVSLTRGELGPIADARLATRETLGEVREGELRRAAAVLGAQWARCLTLPDGELPWVDEAAAIAALTELLRPHEPQAILTFGADGLYGHPDHAAAGAIAHRAARELRGVEVYEAAWPAAMVPALASAAVDRGLPGDLWGLDPEAFGCERHATITVDVRPVLEQKLAALRTHATQLASDHLLAALPLDLAEEFLGVEPWAGPATGRLPQLIGDV
jgi:LmbE family N-acetylglucosaminyl deacetylase